MTDVKSVSGTLVPYLIVRDAKAAIAFYVAAFGASEDYRLLDPTDGRVGHAELRLGDSALYLADEYPDFGALGPVAVGGTPVRLHLPVADVDAVTAKAVAAGAILLRAPKDEFHGNRQSQVADPFGHVWFLSSEFERVSPAEMQRRFDAMMTG